jgi:uncharacterized protein YijF (DUF1287 family)
MARASENVQHNQGIHRKRPFYALAAACGIAALVLVVLALVTLGPLANAFTTQNDGSPDHSAEFGIAQVTIGSDRDSDGLDDQLDLLMSSRDYVATRPRYKSAYYAGGYPNNGYGVCTDVVAAAYLGAGYDLRQLVDADIRLAPESYGIDVPDSNIDYRRVRNLRVFFERNATSLTCDPSDIAEWQGGDIVVFENHIGIVSEKRNERGITYVIHHNDPWQKSYEQDILETRTDIVGHYRLKPEGNDKGAREIT